MMAVSNQTYIELEKLIKDQGFKHIFVLIETFGNAVAEPTKFFTLLTNFPSMLEFAFYDLPNGIKAGFASGSQSRKWPI